MGRGGVATQTGAYNSLLYTTLFLLHVSGVVSKAVYIILV